jgi:pimeloyl-ACP methyl ester carboxylesterase
MEKNYFLGLSEEGFHRIAYTEWGVPNTTNAPIICVHGLTRNGRDFDSLADYLSNLGEHVYCPDIVGRGDSDWLKNPLHYTYEQYIADMNALIARTQGTEVDWIGTSMGGLLGMFLASMPTSPIRRLVLNDIGPQIPVNGLARLAKYAGREPDFESLEEAKKYFKLVYADFGPLNEAQWQQFTEHSVKEIRPGKFVVKLDHGIKLAQTKSKIAWHSLLHPLKAMEGTFFDIDLWETFRKITCPLLVIHGKQSDILLPSVIQRMQQTRPDMEVVEIPETGHAPALLDLATQQIIHRWLHKSR